MDGGLVPFDVMPFMTNGNLLDFLDKNSEHLCVVPWKTTGELTESIYKTSNGSVAPIINITRSKLKINLGYMSASSQRHEVLDK